MGLCNGAPGNSVGVHSYSAPIHNQWGRVGPARGDLASMPNQWGHVDA